MANKRRGLFGHRNPDEVTRFGLMGEAEASREEVRNERAEGPAHEQTAQEGEGAKKNTEG